MRYYLYQQCVKKVLASSRFRGFAIMLPVVMVLIFRSAMNQIAGYQIGALEMLPCLLGGRLGSSYYVFFLFLIVLYPDWDAMKYVLPRLGKRKWFITQCLSVSLISIVYYLLWTVSMMLAVLPRITWKNEWSSFMRTIVDPVLGPDFENTFYINMELHYSKRLVELGSPLMVWALTFLAAALATTFLGVLLISLNICLQRGIGTLLTFLLVIFSSVFDWLPSLFDNDFITLKNANTIKETLRHCSTYLNMLYRCDLSNGAENSSGTLLQIAGGSAAYYIILIAVILLFGFWRLQRTDMCRGR